MKRDILEELGMILDYINTYKCHSHLYMESIIKEFVSETRKPYLKYNSCCHCYDSFGRLVDKNILALHLGFYLVSWGMYRGSSNLLQKDYLVHVEL